MFRTFQVKLQLKVMQDRKKKCRAENRKFDERPCFCFICLFLIRREKIQWWMLHFSGNNSIENKNFNWIVKNHFLGKNNTKKKKNSHTNIHNRKMHSMVASFKLKIMFLSLEHTLIWKYTHTQTLGTKSFNL